MPRLFFLLAFFSIAAISQAQLSITNLKIENRTDPIGIDATSPRFSWQLNSTERNVLQTAYEIQVATEAASLVKGKNLAWSSGKISSDSSVHVVYKGKQLQSGEKYFWKVKVWDNHGHVAESGVSFWQMGLLHTSDWKAKWIEPGFDEEISRPSPQFRKLFVANKKIVSATAYITSHGMYQSFINGEKIGDGYLTPGWTSYNKRLEYQVYDITKMIKPGANAIGVVLGNGWYRSYLAWGGNKDVYGKDIALLFQLEIKYSDGSKELIVSDSLWRSSTGGIRYAEIYHGEIFDDRKETNWMSPEFNSANWNGVRVKDYDKKNLIATENELVKKHEIFKPVKILTTPKGEKVIDFGQNLVGWVMMKAKGNAGDTITIYHAEVLDKFGNFYTENLRAAKAEAKYILSGGKEENFEPHFTFFGFRYIKIEGYPGEIKPENFTAVALYSDMQPTGSFSCSDSLINKLQHNIQWGQKGNFLDVPTDCPQRDERLGWTGDAQVFSRTAAFNMNVNNFFSKWLKDVAADQYENGSVPHVIPNVLGKNSGGSTGWADVSTIIPWNMYLAYGDKKILQDQYNSMKAWVDYMTANSKNNLWNKGSHFGDWLFYRPFDDNDGRSAVTDKYFIAQCFYARSTQLLINAAKVLGKNDDAAKYSELLQKVKDAFLREYVTPNGRLLSSTQTAYVLALNFDMLPESMREETAARLADNVKSYGNHLTTGFLGTSYLCHVLTRFGYDSVAYKLLFQKTYPSWLYPVTMGATTIWERWDGIKPDSTFEVSSMNSFNHYSYGAIGDWMYRVICGIDVDEAGPGYKKIILKPHLGNQLSSATASIATYYGQVRSSWVKETDGSILWNVEIPANTTAIVYLPAKENEAISEGKNNATQLNITKVENGYKITELGSGSYSFSISPKK